VAIQDLLASPALINSGKKNSEPLDTVARMLASNTWRDTALDIITEQDRGVWLLTFRRTSSSPAHRGGADDPVTGPRTEPGKVERVVTGEQISEAG
jgi:hypothetical protein